MLDNQLILSKKGAKLSLNNSYPSSSDQPQTIYSDLSCLKKEGGQSTIFLYERKGGARLIDLRSSSLLINETPQNMTIDKYFVEKPRFPLSETLEVDRIAFIIKHVPKIFEIESKYFELYKNYHVIHSNLTKTIMRYRQSVRRCSDQTLANELLFVNIANLYK